MLNTILTIAGILIGLYIFIIVLIFLLGERGPYLKESTKAFAKEAGWKRILNPLSFIHGYFYLRWLKQYISLGLNYFVKIPFIAPYIIEKIVAPRYHAKGITHRQAKDLISIDKDIPLQDMEHVVPYPVARNLLIQGPPDVAVMECPCRTSKSEHCSPTQVCMIIGQPFVDFILEHTPDKARRLTQEEALELIEEEHKRGHMQFAYFKDALMDRFYAICNCCACCCGALHLMTKYNIPMISSSGYVARIDEKSCNSCDRCVSACKFEAISSGENYAEVNWDKCMGCGVCVSKCKQNSITLELDAKKGAPLDVQALLS